MQRPLQFVEGSIGLKLIQLDPHDCLATRLAGIAHGHVDVGKLPLQHVVLPAESPFYFIDRNSPQFNLAHTIRTQPFKRAKHSRGYVCTRIVPIHNCFTDGVDGYRIRPTTKSVEVLDQVVTDRAEWSIALACVERIHDEPFGIRRARQVHYLLINVIAMAAHHPVVIGKIAELKLHRPSESGVEMDLPFGQADIYIRIADWPGDRKFIEADGPVDRV